MGTADGGMGCSQTPQWMDRALTFPSKPLDLFSFPRSEVLTWARGHVGQPEGG